MICQSEIFNNPFLDMLFDPKSAKNVGKKSQLSPTKKEGPSINEKTELIYEKVLNNLLLNQEILTKTEPVKLFVSLSIYILKKKSVRDQFTIKQLKKIFNLEIPYYNQSIDYCIKVIKNEA